MSVLVETSLGSFVIDLYTKERPMCSLNFLKLCKLHYFNGCLFHSVQKNLVAQTGDPTATGRGGSSVFEKVYGEQAKYFECELKPKIFHKKRGTVSMVNNGHNELGSQFFVTLADDLDYLNNKHAVFGMLAEGFEFLSKVNEVYCDKEHRPYRNIRIHHTIVLDDPFPDMENFEIPPCSPEFFSSYEELDIGVPRLEEDEELDANKDAQMNEAEIIEKTEIKEARANAQLLTLLGDLPDVDARPPDNVLFVCRLNPVTEAADLEVIFSRFGEILSCEVIRDRRTGASLQYAFIEFSNNGECEEAYLKMDNVVIDDRRIHVDFSQSVSKEWHKFRRQKYEDASRALSQRRRSRESPYTYQQSSPGRHLESSARPSRYHHPQKPKHPVRSSPTRRYHSPPVSDKRRRRTSFSSEEHLPSLEPKGLEFLLSDSGNDSDSLLSGIKSPRKEKKQKKSKHSKKHSAAHKRHHP